MDEAMCLPSGSKNTDFTRDELIKLLVYFEGELEAKEIAIAALKTEKLKTILQHAKYNRLKFGDPVLALTKDSNWMQNEDPLVALNRELKQYESPIQQLEKYIALTKQCHDKSKHTLEKLEKQHERIVHEMEAEKERHKASSEQGDDLMAVVENEHQKLQTMLEQKEEVCKQLEADLRKKDNILKTEKEKHKAIVLYLINERKEMLLKMHEMRMKMQTPRDATAYNETPFVNELRKEIHSLREEKNRLNATVSNLHSEKMILQQRVEELDEDLIMLRQNILFRTRQQSDGFIRPNHAGGLVVANKAAIVSDRNQQTIKAKMPNSSSFPATVPSTSTKAQQSGNAYRKFPTVSGSVLPRPNGSKPPTGMKTSNLPVRPYTANSISKPMEPEIEQLGAVIDSMNSRPKTTGSITKRSSSLPRNINQTPTRISDASVNSVNTQTSSKAPESQLTKIGHSLSPNKVFRLVSGSLPRPINLLPSNENLKKPHTTHIS
uniref:Cortactin-binding protein-2 N-terminal domain-containing protein n=1 Tax=Acrobeloides nanus TaxID=290746 RepID=A0A914D2V5_9BILA